ncbi:hypothetical protein [Streptomyces sp. st115]|uniref:hypothetical protein n=1 Tax=Streptomyces sp. st115 TaxID=1828047 RepID=UPI00118011B1|nr:hypothetical protein [Streptomyces sp. st115]
MGPAKGQRTGTNDNHEMNSVVVADPASIAQRMRHAVRPGVAAEPDMPQAPHEAARSQARRARVEKAAVRSDRLAVAAARGEDLRGFSRSPLARAAVLLGALGMVGGTEVRVSGTPVGVEAEVRIRTDLTEGEHERLLEVLAMADRFGHSVTRQGGETVWASYGPAADGDRQPRSGASPPGASFRPGPAAGTAAFYTAPARSHDAEYHPPV